MSLEAALAAYRATGAAIAPGLVDAATLEALRAEFERLAAAHVGAARSGAVYGVRGLLRKSPLVASLAVGGLLVQTARQLIGPAARPVRGIFFDKTLEANWPLPWHQDRMAALDAAAPAPEFRNWTVKDGAPHAELPPEYLAAMVSLRVHLDDCDGETGALMVLPGLHTGPVLADAELRALAAVSEPVTLAARAGETVIMSPLTPHASRRATRPSRRRVLHLEYCARELPEGVRWSEAA